LNNKAEEKRLKNTPDLKLHANASEYAPTQTQIDSFARRLMPEIKKFFADEQVQREFEKWKEINSRAVEK